MEGVPQSLLLLKRSYIVKYGELFLEGYVCFVVRKRVEEIK